MREWVLDLHIHSLLSPCADMVMTPSNVVRQAKQLGIDAIAITDHNTAENAASFIEKGRQCGLTVIPGMELQTREDVHIVCLFDSLEQINKWQEIVYKKLPLMENNKHVFGEQWVVDKDDNFIKELDQLLLIGSDLTVDEAVETVHELGGICIASHVDRPSYSLWGHLGYLPDNLQLDGVELTPHLPRDEKQLQEIVNAGFSYVVSSDAHYEDSIKPPQCFAYMEEVSTLELKKAMKNKEGRYIRTLR
jgi:PHP family Zn ribbon phosphoesterase